MPFALVRITNRQLFNKVEFSTLLNPLPHLWLAGRWQDLLFNTGKLRLTETVIPPGSPGFSMAELRLYLSLLLLYFRALSTMIFLFF